MATITITEMSDALRKGLGTLDGRQLSPLPEVLVLEAKRIGQALVGGVEVHIDIKIRHSDGTLLTTGETDMVMDLDAEGRWRATGDRSAYNTDDLREMLGYLESAAASVCS